MKMHKNNEEFDQAISDDLRENDQKSADGYGLIDNISYLTRCQVDTPHDIVSIVWKIAHCYRNKFENVLDAGAGDGRFSQLGNFISYIGYEIDPGRHPISKLPKNAEMVRACAFSAAKKNHYDLSIGNPPYVRHHDLSDAWRSNICDWIQQEVGERPHGLSNAYLYFLWLSLISTKKDGLVVLVIPFEWINRPAAEKLRQYIESNGWSIDVYQFEVEPFPRVLTTASVSVIDKRARKNGIRHFVVDQLGNIKKLRSPTRSNKQPLQYSKRDEVAYAQRGLSPGGQKIFVLTEAERAHYGLEIGRDVVPCITSMKHLDQDLTKLSQYEFFTNYVANGKRCWLIRPIEKLSKQLRTYLNAIPERAHDNSTCNSRKIWWKFTLPNAPDLLYSSGFRGDTTKVLVNEISAVCVGSVCGIYTQSRKQALRISEAIKISCLKSEVVAVSRGFTKIEVNQMNSFIQREIGVAGR
nr:class I SAM-dependent methyltransferase [Burkholderia cenocepacia]